MRKYQFEWMALGVNIGMALAFLASGEFYCVLPMCLGAVMMWTICEDQPKGNNHA